jgi:opacity protein-like surface antigen
MKMIAIAAAAALGALMAVASPASADTVGWYGSFGASKAVSDTDGGFLPIDLDEGYEIGGAVGYDVGDWRGELEVAYLENTGELGPITVTGSAVAVTVNAFYDIALADRWTLSAGGGIGVATDAGIKIGEFEATDTKLTYKGAVQVAYDVNDSTQLYIGYTYRSIDDTDFETHAVGAGVRIYFGA